MRDPYVGGVLALIHADPARGWSLDELSRAGGLSRSALTRRFTTCTGVPPMRYLTSCRLQRAVQRLRESTIPVARVGFDAGYTSEAAFTRAYKREFGMAPAMFRKAQSEAHDVSVEPTCRRMTRWHDQSGCSRISSSPRSRGAVLHRAAHGRP